MNRYKTYKFGGLPPLSMAMGLLLAFTNPQLGFSASPTPQLAPGAANDTTADGVLGQLDFTHNIKNFVDGRGFSMTDQVGDITIDKSVSPNRVYATDRPNHRVLGWNDIAAFATHAAANIVIGQPDFSSTICNNGGVTATSLCNPTGVAVDSLGNLYIADASNHRVLFYKTPFTSDKAADDVIGQYGSLTTNFCNGFVLNENALCTPVRVALDASNNLYVSDQSNHRVLEYNTPQSVTATIGSGDMTADRVFGQLTGFGVNSCNNGGISANSLCTPIGIALDSAGSLFVADFSNNRVLKYNTPLTTDTTADKVYGQSNAFNTGIANKTGINGVSMNGPMSVTVAPNAAGGAVYISERGNNRVVGYPATTATGPSSTTGTKVLGQFGSLNTAICNNTNLGTVTTPTSAKALCAPDGVALDTSNTSVRPNSPRLYVSDTLNHRLLQFKPSAISAANPTLIIKNGQAAQAVIGQSLMTTNFQNSLDNRGFNFSDGGNVGNFAIDKSVNPNRIYVSDFANNRVLAWSDIGAFATHAAATLVIGQPNAFVNTANNGGISASSLSGPRGLAVDSAGNLYIADQNNHRILQYNTPFTSGLVADRVFGQSGVFTTGFCNQSGLNGNSLCTPTGLAIDSTNSLYVADWSNNRVLKYNTPLTTGTTADKVYGQANSMITNSCNLGGITANSLCNPHGVAIDNAGNVYIADYSNSRVLAYSALPAPANTTADRVFGQNDVFTTNACDPGGVTATTLCRPRFLAVNSLGHVFVADNDNTRVLKFNSPLTTDRIPDRVFGQGNVFTTNGCKISGNNISANNLCGIDGIAVDPSNNLYIVDGNNNRVLRYLAP